MVTDYPASIRILRDGREVDCEVWGQVNRRGDATVTDSRVLGETGRGRGRRQDWVECRLSESETHLAEIALRRSGHE